MTFEYKVIYKEVAWHPNKEWMWPLLDHKLLAVFDSVSDLDLVLPLVSNRKTCVQAGGAVGIWPLRLAQEFEWVYTFEPHPHNFRCLAINCLDKAENIIAINSALASDHGRVGMVLPRDEENNHGAFQVCGGNGLVESVIPATTIDSLRLDNCGLIYLDIEGFEQIALQGAEQTIDICRPVIVVEDKGLSGHYGIAKGDVERYICTQFGYNVVARPNRDVVMVPQ
jgi:FkbM family methyltransferase